MSSAFEQNSPLLPDELIMQTAARWKMIDKPVLAEKSHPFVIIAKSIEIC